jgi:hypothetical protein
MPVPDPSAPRAVDRNDPDLTLVVREVILAYGGALPRRRLWGEVTAWLEAEHPGTSAPSGDAVLRALGMLIVAGAVDEDAGLLVETLGRARRTA